ncbi:hypothetical protein GEV33_005840 [Tenebrio molitor]|uniref:Uncharacterized protein n=1 Tax=Tenebrio molitor TaxID=7067 RepID=A0A8J6LEK1_TENMO|nr:hypothetical protein GEV33_005840 [Tenebrio molitor]
MMPVSLIRLADVKVLVNRIENFLLNDYQKPNKLRSEPKSFYRLVDISVFKIQKPEAVVCIDRASVKWDQSLSINVLSDITFTAASGELVGVVGTTGSGKSTLLQMILKEMDLEEGNVCVRGTISYAPQDSWIFSASIRQNILFGQDMDKEKYHRVLRCCALERDLSLFPHGDQTLVGERGIMLSGGQKARVNLARAVYRDADIYLLDDPLSAVDSHVARHIFETCFLDYLKNKCIVLVTHQIQFLHNISKIYLLQQQKLVELNERDKLFALFTEETKNALEIPKSIALTECDSPSQVPEHRIILVSIINYYTILPSAVLLLIIFFLCVVLKPTSTSIKRTEAITKSSIFAHSTATMQGLSTVRALDAQKLLTKEFDDHQNLHTSAFYLLTAVYCALGFWTDVACVLYIAFVAFKSVHVLDVWDGNVGLAITQSVALVGYIPFFVKMWGEVETHVISVERVLEYVDLPPELDEGNVTPPRLWPQHGKITFKSVSLKYSLTGPLTLNQVSFEVQGGEKIGIVGRTGAGKTSLITTLFRFYSFDGTVIIDDVDVKSIPLNDLRSKISVIPQDPVLFLGTLRKNLDPFDEFSDDEIWNVFRQLELNQIFANLPNGIDTMISEGGSNFSVGQRQLLCLVRTVLRGNKIIILDEATANVDLETDELIQLTIKKMFTNCTVLTVAHRLNTVIDSDKILVMDDGCVAEFDTPYQLLQNSNGLFYAFVKENGEEFLHNYIKAAENCATMVLCYESAHGVGLRAQALYREKFPARRVPHSQTFLAVVYGKMVLFDCIRQQEFSQIPDDAVSFARIRDNLHRRAQACIRNYDGHIEHCV